MTFNRYCPEFLYQGRLQACFVFGGVHRISFAPVLQSRSCQELAAVCDCGTPWTFLLTCKMLSMHLYFISVLTLDLDVFCFDASMC